MWGKGKRWGKKRILIDPFLLANHAGEGKHVAEWMKKPLQQNPPPPQKKGTYLFLSVHYSINFTFLDGAYFLVFQQKKDEQLFQVDQILMQQATSDGRIYIHTYLKICAKSSIAPSPRHARLSSNNRYSHPNQRTNSPFPKKKKGGEWGDGEMGRRTSPAQIFKRREKKKIIAGTDGRAGRRSM